MSLIGKKYEKALGFKEKEKYTLYGEYNGYEVTLYLGTMNGTIMYVNFYGDVSLKQQVAALFISNNDKLTSVAVYPYGIQCVINAMTDGGIIKKIKARLDIVTSYLKEHNVPGVGYCMASGTNENVSTINYNNVYVTLNEEIINRLEMVVKKEEEKNNQLPNNYLKGALGALIGALVGAAALVALYFLGFLSAFSAILAVYLGNFLYMKFAKKNTKMKYVIVGSISFVVMILSCLLLYIYIVNSAITNGTGQNALEYIMSHAELKVSFIRDMALNGFFTIIGIAAQIFDGIRKDKRDEISLNR